MELGQGPAGTYKGKTHPFKIEGLSVGEVGITKAQATGSVFTPAQFLDSKQGMAVMRTSLGRYSRGRYPGADHFTRLVARLPGSRSLELPQSRGR
jgi:hypothetical protein